jgi:hypothetical protein
MNVSIPNGSLVIVAGNGEPQVFLFAQSFSDLNEKAFDQSMKKLDKLDVSAVQIAQGPARLIAGHR